MEQKENNVAISKSLTTNHDSFIKIGHIQKAHGVKGEILFISDSGEFSFPQAVYLKKNSLKSADSANISKKNLQYMPIFKSRLSHKGVIIQFKNCETRDQALSFAGKEVYLEKQHFQSKDFLYLCELLGFNLYVRDKMIGVIDHFLSHSHQDLLVVKKSFHERIEIPFVRNYVQGIHFEEKVLILDLPKNFPGIDDSIENL